jgi:excinuclease UvrABC nuclease subunit
MKKCNKCSEIKILSEFNQRQGKCKVCEKEYYKQRRKDKVVYYRQYRKQWDSSKGGGVYFIRQISTGKIVYIGQTSQLTRRRADHFSIKGKKGGTTTKVGICSLYNENPDDLHFGVLYHGGNEQKRLEIEKRYISLVKPKYNQL